LLNERTGTGTGQGHRTRQKPYRLVKNNGRGLSCRQVLQFEGGELGRVLLKKGNGQGGCTPKVSDWTTKRAAGKENQKKKSTMKIDF